MRLIPLALGLPALLLAGCDSPAAPSIATAASPPGLAATAFTDNVSIPLDQSVFIQCANGGAGELVTISGTLHVLFHQTFNDAEHVTTTSQFNPQGVYGIGEITGRKYQGTGVTKSITTARIGEETTIINNFRIIGQGPGNNFLVHETFHFTVNANGTTTATVDNLSVDCK
jgi:hypothetical protein